MIHLNNLSLGNNTVTINVIASNTETKCNLAGDFSYSLEIKTTSTKCN